ncbi:MAG: hypothetical protein NTW46_03405 [Candidatus Nealsonbacteria bacterium]|nr:hypothetical protein [Candidatus Nealsonbacteria bacterium]
MPRNNKKWIYIILGILVCADIVAFSVILDLSKPKYLEVTFFDIGQGDASFIE